MPCGSGKKFKKCHLNHNRQGCSFRRLPCGGLIHFRHTLNKNSRNRRNKKRRALNHLAI